MTIYHIEIYHPVKGVFLSEPMELNDAGRKNLLDHMILCTGGREVLSFNDDEGNVTMFPHGVLAECIVRLITEDDDT